MNKKTKRYRKKRNTGCLIFIVLGVLLLAMVGHGLQKIFTIQAENKRQAEQVIKEKNQFIRSLIPTAQALQKETGVLTSISLSQAILESDWGKSKLASEYHNLFGMKAGKNQPKVHLETMEFEESTWKKITADFRVFASNEDSLKAHAYLFVNGTSWNPKQYQKVLVAKNYQEATRALQESGYATDPTYGEKLQNIIQQYHLDEYDNAN